jgi:hypothetical protein
MKISEDVRKHAAEQGIAQVGPPQLRTPGLGALGVNAHIDGHP